MAVPEQGEFYRPVLMIGARTSVPLSRQQLVEQAAGLLSVDAADRQQVFGGSGTVKMFDYRVDSAARKLEEAGLLSRPQRGRFRITQAGHEFLASHTGNIARNQLVQLARVLQSDNSENLSSIVDDDAEETTEEIVPQELMSQAYRRLHSDLASDLLASIKGISPDRFEQLVVDLLENMGYGQGETVGRIGDGGIDGIINQDALGLEKVYVQAKRWANQVGEPAIRNFSGSLDPYGATKGVFITTSTFSSTARQTAQTISSGNKFIRLVDGPELARLMIAHGVGVVTEYTYEIKKLDENYFADDV